MSNLKTCAAPWRDIQTNDGRAIIRHVRFATRLRLSLSFWACLSRVQGVSAFVVQSQHHDVSSSGRFRQHQSRVVESDSRRSSVAETQDDRISGAKLAFGSFKMLDANISTDITNLLLSRFVWDCFLRPWTLRSVLYHRAPFR